MTWWELWLVIATATAIGMPAGIGLYVALGDMAYRALSRRSKKKFERRVERQVSARVKECLAAEPNELDRPLFPISPHRRAPHRKKVPNSTPSAIRKS